MAMNKQRRTSNINNVLTYDTLNDVTAVSDFTADGVYANFISIGTSPTPSWLSLAAPTTSKAQINLAAGVDPTSPLNGDLWATSTDIKCRLNGVTYSLLDGGNVPTTRTLTINGISYDLSANRTWSIPTENIYNTSGVLSSGRSVDMNGFGLTFNGSSIQTVIDSAGRLLVGGVLYNLIYNFNVNGSSYLNGFVTITGNLNLSAQFNLSSFGATFTETTSLTSPSAGKGFLYAKTDKKIYYKNSDGTDYDLTANSGGTVTGTGTANYITKWATGGTGITNSIIYDNGSNVLVNSTTNVQGALQVTQNGGGVLIRTDNINFGLGIVNTGSSNKTWDITPFNNQLSFNESGIGSVMMFHPGGNITINSLIDVGYKVDILGTVRIQGSLYFSDNMSIIPTETNGLKIGTATNQKISLWNATPIVQPTTSIAEASFVENSGGAAINVDSTFAGYTIQQIAQALKNFGLLA